MTANFNTQKYGPWVLLTGAGRELGIGYGFARQLAAWGLNLVLVDVLGDEVRARAEELTAVYNVQVRPIELDLGRPDFMTELVPQTADLDLGLLICNHMYTPKDTPTFLADDIDNHLAMLNINARAYLHLVHHYGRQFVAQGRGGIIIVSSGAAFHGTAYTASYAANKAYQMILGESLWYELKDTAVDLLILTPGLTNTHPEGMSGYNPRMVMDVEPVVTETLAGLGHKHLIIPGRLNKLTFFALDHLMSRRRAIETIGKSIMGKGLDK